MNVTEVTEIPVDRATKRAVDAAMTVEERVTLALESYKKREIYQPIDDIATKAGMRTSAVYQALYRMVKKGKVEILKESSAGGKQKIIGVKVNFAESPERIIHNGAERAKNGKRMQKRIEVKVSSTLLHLNKYMEQKIAVEKANQILHDSGLDDLCIQSFSSNPLGEEAISIYRELVETKDQLREALLALEETRRINRVRAEV